MSPHQNNVVLHTRQSTPWRTPYRVTSDIRRRLLEHYNGHVIHTRRYQIRRLVHIEFHDRVVDAITREKHLKKWLRAWKITLIQANNPKWEDLAKHPVWLN